MRVYTDLSNSTANVKKRISIVELKEKYPERFGRFIMALKNLINSDDWGRICGIHGNTFNLADTAVKCPTDPDVVTKIGGTGEPFYCKHSVYSFIGWHTPYVYQFELLLNKHNKSSNDDYISLPWLDLTDFSADYSFLDDPEITVFYEKRKVTTENPLAGAYYYVKGQRVRTVRNGFFSPANKKQRLQLDTVRVQCNNALYAEYYETFSSGGTKNVANGEVVNYVPLETPHNSLHNIIGGKGGNMSSIDIAAFDPIFWLHHCNMDRHYYTWMYKNTCGFKKSIYPCMTDDTYLTSCPPFFKNYVYSDDWWNYRWGWSNGSGKYMELKDALALNRFPYTYDLIKPSPYVEERAFIELIDIPIPPETTEYNIYLHPVGTVLDKEKHFAGSGVWFGINRAKINCCRCNVARTNIRIDINEYCASNGITKANIDDFSMILDGQGQLIQQENGAYKNYNMGDLIQGGTYRVVI
jgi:hypothetical protein